MRTPALNKVLAAGVLLGVASLCRAQEDDQGQVNRPVITVTAGQGGTIRLPDVQQMPQRFALTGERSDPHQAARAWQSGLGPRMRVGQAEITLPEAR